ncbi:hypothetical protein D5086_010484 [Populus alba]|uniref:Uncharacterized protein n=1 Tax=Populus alba TaxID=43335 RepID=A0ACC4CAD5_POPAL
MSTQLQAAILCCCFLEFVLNYSYFTYLNFRNASVVIDLEQGALQDFFFSGSVWDLSWDVEVAGFFPEERRPGRPGGQGFRREGRGRVESGDISGYR